VAALTFIVITSWLLCRGKSLKFVFLPAVFMLITALAALLFQVLDGIRNKDYLIVFVTMALIVLASLMVSDVIGVIRKKGLKCRIF
jgi:carbon starvation protein